ncbi:MAG: carboxypeptidase regulatory-like domain-containing protein [Bacteroidales bacterium]|nr:carboxypeptidase regulatory-like domain-containing protein [Bacteroidales bacterium]
MKLIKGLIIALIVLSGFVGKEVFAQKESENFKVKFAQAWVIFNDDNFLGALKIYRELYKSNPNHAMLNFRMGQCYTELKMMDSALFHLKTAVELDSTIKKEANLLLGQAYQFNGDIDKALDYYYKYKSKLSPRQAEKDYVNVLIQQCLTAKDLISRPAQVKVENMGPSINSAYVDACPSITADGKTLIYTSRRPDNIGGKYDYEAESYYDDIYIAKWNEQKQDWDPSVNIGPPINTEHHDANTSISPDGSTIFIYKNIPNVTQSGDIYYSVKNPTGEWSEPKPILNKLINSSYFESSACITADGNTMFFVSEREKEGFGHGDIYMVKKEGTSWGVPVNLGPTINTPYDEIGVYIHPDGKTLFFSSNGHKTMGGHDIFMSYYENGKWSEPINLGYPINTTREEIHFVLSTDKRTAYISSNRQGSIGEYDIFKVDMSNYFKTNKEIPQHVAQAITGNTLTIMKGKVSDANDGKPIKAALTFKDIVDNQNFVTESNENGEYFITLPSDKRYEVSIKAEGYKPFQLKFKVPRNDELDTPSLIKHFLLNKE